MLQFTHWVGREFQELITLLLKTNFLTPGTLEQLEHYPLLTHSLTNASLVKELKQIQSTNMRSLPLYVWPSWWWPFVIQRLRNCWKVGIFPQSAGLLTVCLHCCVTASIGTTGGRRLICHRLCQSTSGVVDCGLPVDVRSFDPWRPSTDVYAAPRRPALWKIWRLISPAGGIVLEIIKDVGDFPFERLPLQQTTTGMKNYDIRDRWIYRNYALLYRKINKGTYILAATLQTNLMQPDILLVLNSCSLWCPLLPVHDQFSHCKRLGCDAVTDCSIKPCRHTRNTCRSKRHYNRLRNMTLTEPNIITQLFFIVYYFNNVGKTHKHPTA